MTEGTNKTEWEGLHLELTDCPCGHPSCNRKQFERVGTWYVGAGFEPDEAEEIARRVNNFTALEAERDALRDRMRAIIDVYEWCTEAPADRGYSLLDDEIAAARQSISEKSE